MNTAPSNRVKPQAPGAATRSGATRNRMAPRPPPVKRNAHPGRVPRRPQTPTGARPRRSGPGCAAASPEGDGLT
ncbi:hypothetical protein GCM10012283_13070 [Phycicoccus endophyticus]|nr:hypothetical protein GCM10012283_13070 [Phycicoccus endophyticus]